MPLSVETPAAPVRRRTAAARRISVGQASSRHDPADRREFAAVDFRFADRRCACVRRDRRAGRRAQLRSTSSGPRLARIDYLAPLPGRLPGPAGRGDRGADDRGRTSATSRPRASNDRLTIRARCGEPPRRALPLRLTRSSATSEAIADALDAATPASTRYTPADARSGLARRRDQPLRRADAGRRRSGCSALARPARPFFFGLGFVPTWTMPRLAAIDEYQVLS